MAPVQLMPMIDVPFHNVTIDLISSLSPLTDRRNQWILTLVDCAARYAEAIPLSSTTTGVVPEALLSIFTMVGFPTEVLNDNGPQFVSSVMSEVSRLMSIHQVHSTPYRPMVNGVVERFNGTLKEMLIRMCAQRTRDKAERVQEETVPQTVTQVTSFLGLTRYYRKFIPNYATIASPLTNLTKKWQRTKVVWSGDAK